MLEVAQPPRDSYKVAVSRYELERKIPAGDSFWKLFNASFENRSLTSLDLADTIWHGRPFTTWHRNHWRASENYECGQHIGLDFDHGNATLDTLSADKFIAHYGSLLYTTPSHTPEEPRARVVFLLDTPIMQPKNYTLAAAALLWLFGTADRQCKDAVRFFYGSKACDMVILDNVLPLDVVKRLIGQYQETGQRERKHQASRIEGTPEQAEVRDALERIPAMQIEYDEWVSVLMALHATYGDAGLGLADSWAQGYPGEVERKWRSFKPNGNTSGAVTIATVFALAKRYGWQKAA